MVIGEDFDTREKKAKKHSGGGLRRLTTAEIDAIWEEVQAVTRKGIGWKAPKIREIELAEELK
jgi:hypothetical protein